MKKSLEFIFKIQSPLLSDSLAEDAIEDFIIKCIKEGYEKPEILRGINDFYRQSLDVANNIFERVMLKMKNSKNAEKSKFKITKAQWQFIGKKTGWMKTAQIIPDDGFADGGEPYTDEEMDLMEKQDKKSFSYGTTPEKVIIDAVKNKTPSGFNMHIKNQNDWAVIANVVNKGIDSHLEGFTMSSFDNKTGKCLIHPKEMTIFLRRLYEAGDEESLNLRSAILETLGIEEI